MAAITRVQQETPRYNGIELNRDADIAQIYFALMVLFAQNQSLQERNKELEIAAQKASMEKEVLSLNDAAKNTLRLGITEMCFLTAAAVIPVFGHTKGPAILGFLQERFPSLEGYKAAKLTKNISDMCSAGAQGQRIFREMGQGRSRADQVRENTLASIYGAQAQEAREFANRAYQKCSEMERAFLQLLQQSDSVFQHLVR